MFSLADVTSHLAWLDPFLAPLWIGWGTPVSTLESVAFALSIWMVGCNLRVNPTGWPLAIASSVLYGLLFVRSRLYGEAALQWVFIVMSVWGWWQWLRGRDASDQALVVRAMTPRARWMAWITFTLLWPAIGLLLSRATDSDVPWLDALPTAGSLIGQYLLARKRVENWPVWLMVNVVSMVLFAYKQLWLTVLLYGVFAALSVIGWRAWRQMLPPTEMS
ncbi:MAG: nicotinamide riboside transporter PnuC [Aquabacterium sp.]|uniref:nicotinamide riboside transporter PnuC n=1 Tax=Aquabacterium sp. TaxID=1872578 RepID=UPI003BD4969E